MEHSGLVEQENSNKPKFISVLLIRSVHEAMGYDVCVTVHVLSRNTVP